MDEKIKQNNAGENQPIGEQATGHHVEATSSSGHAAEVSEAIRRPSPGQPLSSVDPSEALPSTQEIDLIDLIERLWSKRKFLLKIGAWAAAVGVVIALSLPREYVTTVKLAPETEDISKRMNSLGGLAAMAGINLNTSAGTDAISPDLYPDVVQSTPFLLELFPVKVGVPERADSISLYEYMVDYQRHVWWGYVLQAPFKLLAAGKNLFTSAEEPDETVLNPFHLTRQQQKVVEALQKRIGVSIDKKTLVLTLSVEMQDAVVSASLMQIVLEKLQEYITDYRTRKVKDDLAFTRKVFAEARDTYYQAQKAYATFEDGNRNLISSTYRTEQERLKNEMTLAFNVYNTLAQKLEQDKLRVQEQTPVYTVIEPATVPLLPDSPKKMVIVGGLFFLGVLGGAGYLLMKDMLLANR